MSSSLISFLCGTLYIKDIICQSERKLKVTLCPHGRSRPRQYVHTPGLPPRQLEERAQIGLAALWLMKHSREAVLFSLFCFGLLHLVLRIWADGLSLGVGEVSPARAHSRWKPVGVMFVCLSRCSLGWGLTSARYHMSGGPHPTWVSPDFLWPGAGFGNTRVILRGWPEVREPQSCSFSKLHLGTEPEV